MNKDKNKKEKILIVRYRFIGDTVLTLPFIRNLRLAKPDAQIDILVAPKSGEVIEDCKDIDNVIYFDTTRKYIYETQTTKKKSFFSYVKLIRERKYDKAYILKRSLSSALLIFLAGVKERIGFNTEGRGIFLTKRVKYNPIKHESECFLDVLKADNIEIKDTSFKNDLNPEAEEKIEKILEEYGIRNSRRVIVHATATEQGKTWPKENFEKIIKYLSNEKDCQVIFLGAKNDSIVYEDIMKNISEDLNYPPINFCGKFSIQESLAMIAKAECLIGNDSGNLHMAASVGTKVIGLYGPMPFEKWKALGENNILLRANLPCIPCGLRKKCDLNYECMRKISTEQVINAINILLP